LPEDWIRLGRARRVIIVAGDDVISGSLSQWIGTSLMAQWRGHPEGNLRLAALPFDRRRNGMIIGMGAAAPGGRIRRRRARARHARHL